MARRLWTLVLLLVTLLTAASTTSAHPASGAENRVGAFEVAAGSASAICGTLAENRVGSSDLETPTRVERSAELSPEQRPGNRRACVELASGETLAAGGVPEPLIGPRLGRTTQAFTSEEFALEVYGRYQQFADEAWEAAAAANARGRLQFRSGVDPSTQAGQWVDELARADLHDWLRGELGTEGVVKINRRLIDPGGSGKYRVPDLRTPGHIFDLTIGEKFAGVTPQIDDFILFSGGNRITIVRPVAAGGSYSIVVP